MLDETVKTGAESAVELYVNKLTAAGWEIRTHREDTAAPTFGDGRPMFAPFRQVTLHADGPRTAGHPTLISCWYADLPGQDFPDRPVRFDGNIHLGTTEHEFTSEAEMATWVDALIAVTAALEA